MNEEELLALKETNLSAYELIIQQRGEIEKYKTTPERKGDPEPKPKPEPRDNDPDLRERARLEREREQNAEQSARQIEQDVTFNMGLERFLEEHKDILPHAIGDVMIIAKKQRYDSVTQKANTLRSAFVEEFFSVDANVDLLTQSQKRQLDDYLGLTKSAKESKSAMVYENLFEPALESLKRVKKAEEIGKARLGIASTGGYEEKYKQRLIEQARKHHLGER